jgi:hypothetical protein
MSYQETQWAEAVQYGNRPDGFRILSCANRKIGTSRQVFIGRVYQNA